MTPVVVPFLLALSVLLLRTDCHLFVPVDNSLIIGWLSCRAGSDAGLGPMSAIMHDKRHFQSVLSSGLKSTSGLSAPSAAGGGYSSSLYYDADTSNLSTASAGGTSLHSLYSHDAFGQGHVLYGDAPMSSAGRMSSPVRLVKTESKLAFSSPKANTEASSGANSNRSVLDNEEAAEVLSVMNSPNNYMRPPFNPETVFGSYRDTAASSVGSNSVASHSLSHTGGGGSMQGRGGLLLGDMDQEASADAGVDNCTVGLRGEGVCTEFDAVLDIERVVVVCCTGHSLMKEVQSRAGEGRRGLSIDVTDDSGPSAEPGADSGPMSLSMGPGPSQLDDSATYNSPTKAQRRPAAGSQASDNADDPATLKSPMQSLWDLADFCEKQAEEEQRKSQLNSPVFQRS
jgi:hypothetical protein